MPNDSGALPLPPTPNAEGRPHVYVINSDTLFLEMIGDLLADARAQVTLEQLRPNVEVTMANLRSALPDVLLLDVMPFRRDAPLLLERMAGDPLLREVPVILAATTPGLAEQLADAHATQVREVLPKPFDIDTFFLLLHRVVGTLRVP